MKRSLILVTIVALVLPALALAAGGRDGRGNCPYPGGLAQLLAELPAEELSDRPEGFAS